MGLASWLSGNLRVSHRKQRGVKTTTFTGPRNWSFCGAHGGPTCSPGDKECDPHNLTPGFRQQAGIRQRQNCALFWKWVFLVYTAPENAPTHTAAGPGHRTHCPRAKRAQVWPQTPRGWFLARASVPAQKVRVACAELSATKVIAPWGGEVIQSKETLKIYHYAHARNSATRA